MFVCAIALLYVLYIRPSNQIQQDIYATHNLKKWVLPDLL